MIEQSIFSIKMHEKDLKRVKKAIKKTGESKNGFIVSAVKDRLSIVEDKEFIK